MGIYETAGFPRFLCESCGLCGKNGLSAEVAEENAETALLGCSPIGFAHNEIESAWVYFAEPTVSGQRHGYGDCWVISFKLHSAGNEQIVEFVNVKRAAGFAQEQRARLCDRPVAKTAADRANSACD